MSLLIIFEFQRKKTFDIILINLKAFKNEKLISINNFKSCINFKQDGLI